MKLFKRLFFSLGAVSAALLLTGYNTYQTLPSPNGWPMAGQNQENTSFQSREHIINTSNVGSLAVKWIYNTDAHDADFNVRVNQVVPKSSVIMTPSVDKGNQILYFGDVSGRIHAVNAATGAPIWIKSIVYDYLANDIAAAGTDITKTFAFSRTTPVVYQNLIIFGVRPGLANGSISDFGKINFDSLAVTMGGLILAVDRFDGHLVWKKQVAPDLPMTIPTGSLSLFAGKLYGGLSDGPEEGALPPAFDGGVLYNLLTQYFISKGIPLPPSGHYQCCQGHGLAFSLDASSGQIMWRTSSIEPSVPQGFGGWAGASTWSNNPPIDPSRQSVYITSGNVFNPSGDPSTVACLTAAGANIAARTACMPSGVHQDSVMSLNFKTGAINWARSYVPLDVGGAACFGKVFFDPSTGCNDPLATFATQSQFTAQYIDYDFAAGSMLVDLGSKQVLIAAQKSGTVYSIDPSTGNLNWQRTDGPGSLYGGHEWGMASDGVRVYGQITNANLIPVTLVNEFSPTPTGPGGYFSAVNISNGTIAWQTRDPNVATINPAYVLHASIYGRLAVANGVLFGQSTNHTLLALNASNGQILWKDNSNIVGAGFAAPAVVNGIVYWPTGYVLVTQFPGSPYTAIDANDPYTPYDNKVIAYTVPGASGSLDNSSSVIDTN